MSQIIVGGSILNNASEISHELALQAAQDAINALGWKAVVNDAARSLATANDSFYVRMLAVAVSQGIPHISGKETDNSRFDGQNMIVKSILDQVSEKTSSARKHASEILSLVWLSSQLGRDPLTMPSKGALREFCRKAKAKDVKNEASDITLPIELAFMESPAVDVEAMQAKSVELAQEIERNTRHINDLQDAIMVALYGNQQERKALKEKYPIAA